MGYAQDLDGRGKDRLSSTLCVFNGRGKDRLNNMLCVFTKLIVVDYVFGHVPPGSPRSWEVLTKNFARAPALTPRSHSSDSLIAVEYVFRNPPQGSLGDRPLVFMPPHILTFKSSWIGVEVRTILTRLLVWSVWGYPTLVSPFL